MGATRVQNNQQKDKRISYSQMGSKRKREKEEYHRNRTVDAAVGATIGATKRGTTCRVTTATTAAEFSRIPRQTKRSRDQ